MEIENKSSLMIRLFCILAIIIIISADLFYIFGNYDTPFYLVIILYFINIFIKKASSFLAFILVLFCVVSIGFSYNILGTVRFTERIGEWFYILLLLGLLHSGIELWHLKYQKS